MRNDKINSVLLVGEKTTKASSLLFQCANYWSAQGEKVLYISSTPFDKLPSGIHGMPSPNSDSVSQIRFMYLPRWQDFMKQMYSIHLYPYIPRIIIVDRLDHYCNLSGEEKTHEKYETEMRHALVSAALLDATSVCAQRSKTETALVVFYEYIPGQENRVSSLIDTFFNDVVWFLEQKELKPEEREGLLAKLLTFPRCQKTNVEFVTRKYDEALVVKSISNFIRVSECDIETNVQISDK